MAFQLGPQEKPQYALEGSIAIAGAGISWLRDQLGLIQSAEESEALAASVPNTAGCVMLLLVFIPGSTHADVGQTNSSSLYTQWQNQTMTSALGHTVETKLSSSCLHAEEGKLA